MIKLGDYMAEKVIKRNDIIPGCIGDCRVSSSGQSQYGESLDIQEALCRGIADSRGWNMLFVSRESYSGRKNQRPRFEENLEYIKTHPGKVKYYIIRAIDRLTRTGSYGYESMKRELAKYGVELIDSCGIIQPPKNTLEHLGVEYSWSKYYPSEVTELIEGPKKKKKKKKKTNNHHKNNNNKKRKKKHIDN